MFKQGELVLIPVPFSDLSASKRRPVVVLSNDDYNDSSEDILVAAVTSNLRERTYTVPLNQEDMENGTLPKPSCIRADKIYSLSADIVIKSIGQISTSSLQAAIQNITALLS